VNVLPGMAQVSPALLAVMVATAIMFAVAIAFLAAAARLRRANMRKAALWARLETKMDALIASIVHGSADAAVLHSRIRPTEHVVLVDYLYKLLVRETRPARRALFQQLAVPYLEVLEKRARTGDVWQRARAIRTLAEVAGLDARGAIMAGLDAPEPHVAMTAARAYAQVGLGPVDPLLARIDRYHHWDRRLLRSVLESFGHAAAPALARTFADRTLAPHSRAVCADALAGLDYGDAADAATHVLLEEDDIDLVAASLRLLGAKSSEAQRDIVRDMCGLADEVVRGQAVACLARIGDDADLVNFVEPALYDPSPWVARSAAHGLTLRTGRTWTPPAATADQPQAADAAVPHNDPGPDPARRTGAHPRERAAGWRSHAELREE
jgi:HEAT repeat protein